jgi:hypothetical protein
MGVAGRVGGVVEVGTEPGRVVALPDEDVAAMPEPVATCEGAALTTGEVEGSVAVTAGRLPGWDAVTPAAGAA